MNGRNGYDFTLWATTGLNQPRGATPTENVADQGQRKDFPLGANWERNEQKLPDSQFETAAGHIGNSGWLFSPIRQAQSSLVPDVSGSTPASPMPVDEESSLVPDWSGSTTASPMSFEEVMSGSTTASPMSFEEVMSGSTTASPMSFEEVMSGSTRASPMSVEEMSGSTRASPMSVEEMSGSTRASPMSVEEMSGSTTASPMSVDEDVKQNVSFTPCRAPFRGLVGGGSDHIQRQRDQAPPTPDIGPNLSGRFICTGCRLFYDAVVYANQYSSCPRCGGANLPVPYAYPLPLEIRAILQYGAQGYHQDNGPPLLINSYQFFKTFHDVI